MSALVVGVPTENTTGNCIRETIFDMLVLLLLFIAIVLLVLLLMLVFMLTDAVAFDNGNVGRFLNSIAGDDVCIADAFCIFMSVDAIFVVVGGKGICVLFIVNHTQAKSKLEHTETLFNHCKVNVFVYFFINKIKVEQLMMSGFPDTPVAVRSSSETEKDKKTIISKSPTNKLKILKIKLTSTSNPVSPPITTKTIRSDSNISIIYNETPKNTNKKRSVSLTPQPIKKKKRFLPRQLLINTKLKKRSSTSKRNSLKHRLSRQRTPEQKQAGHTPPPSAKNSFISFPNTIVKNTTAKEGVVNWWGLRLALPDNKLSMKSADRIEVPVTPTTPEYVVKNAMNERVSLMDIDIDDDVLLHQLGITVNDEKRLLVQTLKREEIARTELRKQKHMHKILIREQEYDNTSEDSDSNDDYNTSPYAVISPLGMSITTPARNSLYLFNGNKSQTVPSSARSSKTGMNYSINIQPILVTDQYSSQPSSS